MAELDSRTPDAAFTTTHWSLVLAAGKDGSQQSQQALEQLCRAYWYPLYSYARRQGRSAADAEDLTQEFFARLLAKDYLRLADRERGRFRTFLLTSLKHFLVSDWQRRQAERRGGGAEVLPFQADGAEERFAAEPAEVGTPELHFDRGWAATLIEQTLAALRAEYAEAGKADLFEQLKPFVGAGAAVPPPHEAVAAVLGQTPGAVRVSVSRLRDRYRALLRAAVSQTVASPADVDDELRHLIKVLRAA